MAGDDEFGVHKRASEAEDASTPGAQRRSDIPDSIEAGRSVLDALGIDAPGVPPAAPRRRSARAKATAEGPASAAPEHVPAPAELRVGRWTEPIDNITAAQATTDIDFPARTGVRRTLGIILVVVFAAAAVASYVAWQEPTTATVGIAGILGVVTLFVWAGYAGSTPTELSIRRGQLSVRRGGRTEVVQLSSQFTPVAILGEPGQRRWRVLIERADEPLITITPAMVDSHRFTTALYRVRPDLRPKAETALGNAANHDDPDGHDNRAS